VSGVAHAGAVDVGADVVAVGDVLVEVVLEPRLNLVPVDGHEGVAILTRLLVPKTDRVPDLVDRVARAAVGPEVHELLATSATHGGRASVGRTECHPVRVLGGV